MGTGELSQAGAVGGNRVSGGTVDFSFLLAQFVWKGGQISFPGFPLVC